MKRNVSTIQPTQLSTTLLVFVLILVCYTQPSAANRWTMESGVQAGGTWDFIGPSHSSVSNTGFAGGLTLNYGRYLTFKGDVNVRKVDDWLTGVQNELQLHSGRTLWVAWPPYCCSFPTVLPADNPPAVSQCC